MLKLKFFFFSPMRRWYVEQSDRKCRMTFNTAELEVLAEEVNTHSVQAKK